MENVWDYLRGNKLSRLVQDSYEAIVAACKDAWQFLIGDPQRIDSIARRSWVWVNLQGRWYNRWAETPFLLVPIRTDNFASQLGLLSDDSGGGVFA